VSERILHLVVRGKVQGVGFRWHVAAHARRLDLAGWVKNRSDGAVELCAAGSADALSSLESEIVRGPDGANVKEVERIQGKDEGNLPKPFSIMRER
jgi:acylphosphatase